MKNNKTLALNYLKDKENSKLSFLDISELTGYSVSYLKKLNKSLKEKDIDSLLLHGGINNKNHLADEKEINYIIKFKEQYPMISISQFQDIYHEQVIFNHKMKQDVIENNLKKRSYKFFQMLFHLQGWKSPFKHRIKRSKDYHTLRNPMPRRGMLVMIDGTPHDWFQNGKVFSLHLAIDDATGEYLCGYFAHTETLEGYCHVLNLLIKKHGLPENIYSDKHTILKSRIETNLTTFGLILKDLGINQIFANSPQAKGKVERANRTLQGRLLVDIKRHNIKSYKDLNLFFNNYYCDYLNHKFAYEPKDKESAYVKVDEDFKLLPYLCFREKRKILSGNVFSYKASYYGIVNNDGEIINLYKGTEIEVRENIFTKKITVRYLRCLYNTYVIEKNEKEQSVQVIINNQKELNDLLNN